MPKTLSSLYAIDQILQNNHGRGIEDYLGLYLNFNSDLAMIVHLMTLLCLDIQEWVGTILLS